MTAQHSSTTPLHPRAHGGSNHGRDTPVHVVRNVITSAIRHGVHPIGSRINEDTLVDTLNASRATVREAMQILTDGGYLERQRRIGTTVLPRQIAIPWNGMYPDRSTGAVLTTAMLPDRHLAAPELIRRTLTLSGDSALLRQYRIDVNGVPVGFRIGYRDSRHDAIGPRQEPNDLEAHFVAVFRVPLGRVQTTVEYAPSDAKASRELGIPEGSPMLVREQLFFDVDGNAVELAFTQVRADMVSFIDD
jgi:GntR family transcriptional regulator